MQGIEFEDEKDLGLVATKAMTPERKPSFMARYLEKFGISDTSTANLILLIASLIIFSISIFIYVNTTTGGATVKRTAAEISAQLKVLNEMRSLNQQHEQTER